MSKRQPGAFCLRPLQPRGRGEASECAPALFIARQFFQIGFNFADLIGDNAFQMAQIVKDLTFQIDFGAIALADLIQLIDHVAQVWADLLHLFVALTDAIRDNGFALTWIFKLHAFGEKLAFVLLK
jgi:hypothetical protein